MTAFASPRLPRLSPTLIFQGKCVTQRLALGARGRFHLLFYHIVKSLSTVPSLFISISRATRPTFIIARILPHSDDLLVYQLSIQSLQISYHAYSVTNVCIYYCSLDLSRCASKKRRPSRLTVESVVGPTSLAKSELVYQRDHTETYHLCSGRKGILRPNADRSGCCTYFLVNLAGLISWLRIYGSPLLSVFLARDTRFGAKKDFYHHLPVDHSALTRNHRLFLELHSQ